MDNSVQQDYSQLEKDLARMISPAHNGDERGQEIKEILAIMSANDHKRSEVVFVSLPACNS